MLPIRKTLGALVSMTLVGALATTAVSTTSAAPARADEPDATSAVSFGSARLVGVFGDDLSLPDGAVTVTYSDGTSHTPGAGTATLQRQLRGSSTWRDVASDDTLSSLYYPAVAKFTGDMKYRIYYTGGTYTDSSYGTVTATPATSPVTPIATLVDASVRGVIRSGRLFAAFAVAPAARYKVLVQIKLNGAWRRYARTTTNTRGRVRVLITRTTRRGQPYRAIFSGSSRFTATKLGFKGKRY